MFTLALLETFHLQKCLFLECTYPEVFCKKGIVRNFAKFTGKSLF